MYKSNDETGRHSFITLKKKCKAPSSDMQIKYTPTKLSYKCKQYNSKEWISSDSSHKCK